MFDWLEEELKIVKTPHFHEVDGPASAVLREAIEDSRAPIPASYKEFVLRFGNARLYRCSSWYKVEIYAGPRDAVSNDGEELLNFGRTDAGLVYFKKNLLVSDNESPIFTWHGPESGLRLSADGYEEWILKKCTAARRSFNKRQWESIVKGPEPFSERERAIIAARKHFYWRVLGVAENGNLRFEIKNDSNMVLPYISVGIRYKEGPPFGGVKLPVSGIQPGQTAVIEVDCYKTSHDPSMVEAFEKPDPEPALRDLYWEFKELGTGNSSSELGD